MKLKIFLSAATIFACSFNSSALDIKTLLSGFGSGNGSTSDTTSSTTSSIVSALSGILGDVLSSDKLTVDQIAGNWKYSAPAVTFLSDNLLQKAGGAATAESVEGKLAPIYKLTKLDKLTFDVESSGKFTLAVGKIKLSGTIAEITDEISNANFTLNFTGLGKSLLNVNAYITKSIDGSMTLTFDVSKLIAILQKVSSLAKSSTITTVTNALASFDGLCAGFELKK